MKALIFLLFIVGCCNTKQQPARLYLGSVTHPIGTAPLKLTDGKLPMLTTSDTFIMSDTSTDIIFFRANVERGILIKISDTPNCKHDVTMTTLLYCPDMKCNTTSCFTCGKILNK